MSKDKGMRTSMRSLGSASRCGAGLAAAIILLGAGAACTGNSDKTALPPPKPAVEPQSAPQAEETTQSTTATVSENAASSESVEAAEVTSSADEAAATLAPEAQPPASAPASAPAIATTTRLSGEVEAPRRSQIAFRVGGFMAEVIAKPGDKLKAGDVLAKLDDRDYALRLELAKARRDQAQVAADSAAKEYQRERQLQRESASTASMLDKVKATFDQAKLAVKLAQLDVDAAELALKDTRLTAPYDCVVAEQMKHEGENVQSGAPVFVVYDTSEPEIRLSVPERLAGQVAVGTRLDVTVPSASYAGKAEVVRVVPVISERTRTFNITARLLSADGRIVPGSYAEATLN